MTETLYKLGVIAGLSIFLTGLLLFTPDASPLPTVVYNAVNWFFSALYSFNFIFPVTTFLQLVYYSFLFVGITIALDTGKRIISWTLQTT